jgi:hypothetical protein
MAFLLGKKSKVAIAYIIAAGMGFLFLKHPLPFSLTWEIGTT